MMDKCFVVCFPTYAQVDFDQRNKMVNVIFLKAPGTCWVFGSKTVLSVLCTHTLLSGWAHFSC